MMKLVSIYFIVILPCLASGFSTPNNDKNKEGLSRRDFLSPKGLVIGGVGLVYAKVLGDTLSRIARGMEYPADHERRVASTIATTTSVAAAASAGLTALRVLEVGMGSDCRLIRRGLYNDALQSLKENTEVKSVQIVGVDLTKPKESVVQKAQTYLQDNSPLPVDLTVVEGDILQQSSSAQLGSFDAVICCLTLCSVADQRLALERIHNLLKPKGGCLGYVEHVAVNPDEPFRFLEWQQETLDPIQQVLADNCHLHRYTEDTIASVFEGDAQVIAEERFLVDAMWPVTCQSCGVIQRNS